MSTMSSTVGYDIMRADQKSVDGFIERLAAFSLDQWLSIAATHDASLCAGATATLEQLVAHHELGVDAWSIADDVETAFHYSVGSGRLALTHRDCASLRLAIALGAHRSQGGCPRSASSRVRGRFPSHGAVVAPRRPA